MLLALLCGRVPRVGWGRLIPLIRGLCRLLCGVLLLGVLAGCGKKNDTGDTSGDKTVNGTETKNDADSQLTAKYVYQAQYLELPVKTSYIDDSAVSGNTLFFYAQVQDESYAAANSDTPVPKGFVM